MPKISVSEYDMATAAYADFCESNGYVLQSPCRVSSYQEGDKYYLFNANGLMASVNLVTLEVS